MTKSQYYQLKRDAHHLSLEIGVRTAARALGIPEGRLLKWSHRDKWNIHLVRPSSLSAPKDPRESGGILDGLEAKKRILQKMGDRTRVGLARSAMKASEHASELDGGKLMERDTSIALLNHAKVASVTHGWQAQDQVNVNVANLVMPTPEEREERARVHAALDAIAAKLKT